MITCLAVPSTIRGQTQCSATGTYYSDTVHGMGLTVYDQYSLLRKLDLSEITCYGFDMDYTVCEYRAPAMDSLAHTLAKEFIVNRWTVFCIIMYNCQLHIICLGYLL